MIWQSTKIVTLQKGYLGKILYAYGLPPGFNCIHFDVGQCPWVNTHKPELADMLSKMFFSYQRNPRPHITLTDVGYVLS